MFHSDGDQLRKRCFQNLTGIAAARQQECAKTSCQISGSVHELIGITEDDSALVGGQEESRSIAVIDLVDSVLDVYRFDILRQGYRSAEEADISAFTEYEWRTHNVGAMRSNG